ncbi:MAG TPA: hypothetical protein VGP15_22605, partial [Burkholderiales bacterium]|nr:hypothetical protein [Burkholderiales bacterium]
QVFGSKGWVEVGDVEHLTTWQMKLCYVDPDNLTTHNKPQVRTFLMTSTERAELEAFADAVAEGRPLAVAGGDEEHGVAVLEAILESARSGEKVTLGAPQRARRRASATSADSPVIETTKRLLKSVQETLRDVVENVTGTAPEKKTQRAGGQKPRRDSKKTTRSAGGQTATRRASKKSTRSAGKKSARPSTKRSPRSAAGKAGRSTARKRSAQGAHRAATKKAARRK